MSTTLVNGANLAYAHEKISTLTASTALTAATYDTLGGAGSAQYDGAQRSVIHPEEALITVETGAIRWTCDGTAPTTSASTGLGHICQAGDSVQLLGYQNIVRFRAINETASSGAEIRVTYYR